jgi:hypothetical protein
MSFLDPYLDLEDRYTLWEAEVAGVKLWPAVRTLVFNTILERHMGHQPAHHRTSPFKRITVPAIWPKYLWTAAFALRRRRDPVHSVLFFTSARPSAVPIYSHYYERIPNSLVAEYSWNGITSAYRRSDQLTLILQDPFILWAYLRARFTSQLPHEVTRMREFATLVSRQFDVPDLEDSIVKRVKLYVSVAPILQALIADYLLPRLRSKLAFVNLASYMGLYAIIVKLLHELGFTVVEVQHGTVYDAHFAYNYSPQVLQDTGHPSRNYLPDLFLSYGHNWLHHVRVPFQCLVIGNPRLWQVVDQVSSGSRVNTNQILVVSEGSLTGKLVDLTIHLARSFPEQVIIFKLHPAEIGFRERYLALRDLPNVRIKSIESVYELIAESGIIVGATSTVMYEVLAFPGKRTFILENDLVPNTIGTKFTTPDELVALIANEGTGFPTAPAEGFWASDWQTRTNAFIHAYV